MYGWIIQRKLFSVCNSLVFWKSYTSLLQFNFTLESCQHLQLDFEILFTDNSTSRQLTGVICNFLSYKVMVPSKNSNVFYYFLTDNLRQFNLYKLNKN